MKTYEATTNNEILPKEQPLVEYLNVVIEDLGGSKENKGEQHTLEQLKMDLERYPELSNQLEEHLNALGTQFAEVMQNTSPDIAPIKVLDRLNQTAAPKFASSRVSLVRPGATGYYFHDYSRFTNCHLELPKDSEALQVITPNYTQKSTAGISEQTYKQIGNEIVAHKDTGAVLVTETAYEVLRNAYLDSVIAYEKSNSNSSN